MQPRERGGPAGGDSNGAVTGSANLKSTGTLPDPTDHAADVLVDAFLSAWPAWWERRAKEFEAARPNPETDFWGGATIEDLRHQWERLTATAEACRNRGRIAPLAAPDDVAAVLGEAS